MLESMFKELVTGDFENPNRIDQCQHGFINEKSCVTNLRVFEVATDRVANAVLDNVEYLNFQQAFD